MTKITDMKLEQLAIWLHINYEEIAIQKGWQTNEDCKVPFDELPQKNKAVMIELADRIQRNLGCDAVTKVRKIIKPKHDKGDD